MDKNVEKELSAETLPIEKFIVPSYLLYALIWVVIAIVATHIKSVSYSQFRSDMDVLMRRYGYDYNAYNSSKEKLEYEPAGTHKGDITFWVEYEADGYKVESVDVFVYEYHPEILEVLEDVYPQVDFMAFDEPIRSAIDNKSYLNENGQVKINPDPEKYKMDINIHENENSESGYDIMMWLSESQVDQTIANM